MGDRTTVTLSVLKQHKDIVEELSGYFEEEFPGNSGTHCFMYYEVNYSNLDFLKDLESRGIPYKSKWNAGSEYKSGGESCQFTPEGTVVKKIIYDDDINPPLSDLMNLIQTPAKLVEYIIQHKEKVSLMPWENQAEYGKLYLARKLIEPNS